MAKCDLSSPTAKLSVSFPMKSFILPYSTELILEDASAMTAILIGVLQTKLLHKINARKSETVL